jgi:hypothetical protein
MEANPKVNVKNLLHESVHITLGGVTQEIKSERQGPMSIIESPVEPALSFLPMTPLSTHARDLRKSLEP